MREVGSETILEEREKRPLVGGSPGRVTAGGPQDEPLSCLPLVATYSCISYTGLSTNLQLMTNPFNYPSPFPLTNYLKLFGTSLLKPSHMVPNTV